MAAIFPVQGGPPTVYWIQGPVKRVKRYSGKLFNREIWEIHVTVARIGAEHDRDFDLAIFVSVIVLGDKRLPEIGDDVSATIRLQGRIWWPNVQDSTEEWQ
jgi:hypothetical protein